MLQIRNTMNIEQQEIIIAAHYGAQMKALDQAYSMNKRKQALNSLAECGMGRFFIDEDGFLEPTSHGTSRTEDGESWTHWAVFNLSEVNSYIKFLDDNDDYQQVARHGESCPVTDCGGTVLFNSDFDNTRCSTCGSIYADRDNATQLSTCEVKFRDSSYGGPGMVFTKRPHAKVTKRGTRIIVTQYGGYDI